MRKHKYVITDVETAMKLANRYALLVVRITEYYRNNKSMTDDQFIRIYVKTFKSDKK